MYLRVEGCILEKGIINNFLPISFRTYADETNEFLKSFVPPSAGSRDAADAVAARRAATSTSPPDQMSATDGAAVTVGGGAALVGHVAVWNPFDDPSPFCQLSEDHLFGAEFDKIRRGSQSSKFFCIEPFCFFVFQKLI